MADPAIRDPVDPIHSDVGDDIRPNAVVVAGGECGAEESVVSVSEIGTKTNNQAC